jgi:hypothetical protein
MSVTKIDGSRQIKANSVGSGQVDTSILLASGGNPLTGDLPAGSHKITGLQDPTSAQDAATKAYVDSLSAGLDPKASVRAATTANITLSGAQTIDGVSVIAGDRVLVKDQSTGADNGIYVAAAGSWARSTDADASAEVTGGMFTFVEEGTTNGGKGFVLTTANPITLGSTALTFTTFSSAGAITAGAGLSLTGSTLDVNVAAAGGIQITSDNLEIKLDGSSLSLSSSGIKVNTAKFITRETPSGTINGSNTAFTLANTPISGSEQVFLNGLLQEPGAGNDYTISGGTITYLTAPISGDRLRVTYMIA